MCNLKRYLLFALMIFIGESSCFGAVQELYSESLYFREVGIVSDSYVRMRTESVVWPESYFGVRAQLQNADATEKYFENRLIPFIGLQKSFFGNLALIAELRASEERATGPSQDQKSLRLEERVGIDYGDLWLWGEAGKDSLFTEVYGESFWIPKIDSKLLTSLWLKQGYRFFVAPKWWLDPYIEGRYQDREQSFRAGARALYQIRSWTAALYAYQLFKIETSETQILLQIGGLL